MCDICKPGEPKDGISWSAVIVILLIIGLMIGFAAAGGRP